MNRWMCCDYEWDELFNMGGLVDENNIPIRAKYCPECGTKRTPDEELMNEEEKMASALDRLCVEVWAAHKAAPDWKTFYTTANGLAPIKWCTATDTEREAAIEFLHNVRELLCPGDKPDKQPPHKHNKEDLEETFPTEEKEKD